MKRKKQGASLIVVIIIFMFISTVSMAMLSMISSNYKARVVESKRVENLYASESGLDVAYNVIGKTFDAATKYGYYKVEALKGNSNTGPNNPKYQAIKDEIEALKLRDDIDDEEKRSLIEEDKEMQKILLDEEFKRAFKNFIKKTDEVGDEEQIPDKLEESIEGNEAKSINGHKYVRSDSIDENSIDDIDNFIEETINFAIENKNSEPPKLNAEVIYDPQNEKKNEEVGNIEESEHSGGEDDADLAESYPRKEGHSEEVESINITKSENKEYEIIVQSTFYTEKVEDNDNKDKTINERKLQVKYKMLVPNYSDIFYENVIGELHQYLDLNNRALTIGGDMNVGNTTTTNQTKLKVNNGDVFVNGNPDHILSSGRVYGKYFGGITLNNSDEVLFGNNVNAINVVTRGTFNVRSNVGINDAKPAKITGDLYARNIYAGTEDGEGYTDKAYFGVDGEVVIDNDLALKATDTHITIQDFYGINDKNIYYNDDRGNQIRNGNSHPNDKARTSSSIIINDTGAESKGSSVSITNKAYIMGTAHIATEGNYQTGESAAVKGNYMAYSIPLESSDVPESFTFDDGLQLLEEPNVFKKAKHFVNYWRGKNVDTGGIFLPKGNINSVGAVVYKYKDNETNENIVEVTDPNYTTGLEEDGGEIKERRLKFASKVYRFGTEVKAGERDELLAMYNSLGQGATTVESLMDFSGDFPEDYNSENEDDYDLDDEIDSSGEKAIFNSSPDITLIFQGADVDDDKKYYDSEGNEITNKKIIRADSSNKINAVIATQGSVIIDGDVTFNGSIIANKDLTITGDVTINYDSDVIERVQASNIELFDQVFGNNIIEREESTNSNSEGTASNEEKDLATKYDLKNFLESKLWRIIK